MKGILILSAALLVSCASMMNDKKESKSKSKESTTTQAVSDLHSPAEKVTGAFTAQDMNDHIKVTVTVKGLKPNSKHGFHIHENGVCEGPEYKSAGGHFNPHKMPHGSPTEAKNHLGDMGNLEANKQGVATKELMVRKHEADDMNKIIGKALIVHSGPDDLKTQPSGDSGSRIACGIIKPMN